MPSPTRTKTCPKDLLQRLELNTIINTGKDEIRPGDFVMADIPDQLKWDDDPFNRYKKAEGIPLDKLLFSTVRYDVSSSYKYADDLLTAIAGSTTAVKDALKNRNIVPSALRAIQDSNGTFPANIGAAVTAGSAAASVRAVMAIDQQRKRMIIGKALSYARQGEPFDIVLGSQPCF